MRIGYSCCVVSCYCKGCYHIFNISYNGCTSYLGGDHTCPFCGTTESVVRSDCIDICFSADSLIRTYLKDKPERLQEHQKDIEEMKRIERLLKIYGGNPGWYPPSDYPIEDLKKVII